MKVLILMGKFAVGGSQRSVSYLSQYLPKDIETTIVITNPRVDYAYRGDLRSINLSEFKRPNQYYIHVVRFLQKFFSVRSLIKEIQPDFIITLDTQWAILGSLLAKKNIFYIQNAPSISLGTSFYQKIKLRFICRKAFKVVSPSYGVKKDLEENFNIVNVEVIYNAIDLENVISEGRESLSHPIFLEWVNKDYPIFITIGRESWQKGHWHLIRAFSRLDKENNPKLLIMGEGVVEDPFINTLIKDLELNKDILLLDFQKNPFPFLKLSDIFILPSLYEGFGHVCLEAMACGLPVILSDCPGGPREILAPDERIDSKTKTIEYTPYGILAPVCDGNLHTAHEPLTEAELLFAKAMNDLLVDKEKQEEYRNSSLKRVKDFSIDIFISRWLKIFKQG